jgi:hypothetical protein
MPNRRRKLDGAAKAKARGGNAGKIADMFGVREGTNREAVLKVLVPKIGKPVPRATVCKVLYKNTKDTVALNRVLDGLEGIANENKLPFHIQREGRGDDATIALVKGKTRKRA